MRLAEWLKANDLTHGDFAARIGTSQTAVTRYSNGTRFPRLDQVAAIQRETAGAVTISDFYEHANAPKTDEKKPAPAREPAAS